MTEQGTSFFPLTNPNKVLTNRLLLRTQVPQHTSLELNTAPPLNVSAPQNIIVLEHLCPHLQAFVRPVEVSV